MPSSTEKRFIKLATRLIKKRGRDIQLITKVASGEKFDPDFADQSVTIKAAQISFKSTEVDGAIIRI